MRFSDCLLVTNIALNSVVQFEITAKLYEAINLFELSMDLGLVFGL